MSGVVRCLVVALALLPAAPAHAQSGERAARPPVQPTTSLTLGGAVQQPKT
ncbi:MAG: hypothetical protein JO021_06535, partial [Alphaproteobacteria bacterium]|nr:hypothetical protein [Alphaproteobacteria bacterium]